MQITGKHVFLMIAGFFLIIFAANGVLVYYALDSWSGLETENPYQKGIAYNQDIAKARDQEKAGYSVSIKITPSPERVIGMKITALNRDGQPLTGKKLKVKLVRPAKEGFDQVPRIYENSPGEYSGQVQLPLPGIWDIKLDVYDGDKHLYRSKSRIEVK